MNSIHLVCVYVALPLEGDSSMKVYRGKWWVKDSSAVQFVPLVAITRLPTGGAFHDSVNSMKVDGQTNRLELTITNPRDVPMLVSLKPGSKKNIRMNSSGCERSSHAPFFSPTTFLEPFPVQCVSESAATSSGSSAASVTLSESGDALDMPLGAYEDELLRDDDDDMDEEQAVQAAFHAQESSASSEHTPWLTFSKHNYCRVSIPIADVSDGQSLKNTVMFQLPLTISFSVVGVADAAKESNVTSGESSSSDNVCVVDLRITFPCIL